MSHFQTISLFEYLDMLVAQGRLSIEQAMEIRLTPPREVIACPECGLCSGTVEVINAHVELCRRRGDIQPLSDHSEIYREMEVVEYLLEIGEWTQREHDEWRFGQRSIPEVERWRICAYEYRDHAGELVWGYLGRDRDVNDRIARRNEIPWFRQRAECSTVSLIDGPYAYLYAFGELISQWQRVVRDPQWGELQTSARTLLQLLPSLETEHIVNVLPMCEFLEWIVSQISGHPMLNQ